ncbi:MAG: hypothetical protein U9N85_10185 [Bacteroidota bacterium]|nr:hypothetical protein [Bacteroidota bacterium]
MLSLFEKTIILKVISVAFYFGFLDIEAFKKRFAVDFYTFYSKDVEFLETVNIMKKVR